MGYRRCASCGCTVGQKGGTTVPSHRPAKKVVVDFVGLIIRIGDAAESSRSSFGDPSV
jgi:hypothetical protein